MFFLAWGVGWFVVARLPGPVLGATPSAFCRDHGEDSFTCGHSLGSVKLGKTWRAALSFCSPVCGEMWVLWERCAWGARQRNLLFGLGPVMLKLISLTNPSGWKR